MVLDKLTTTASQNISNKFIYHYFYVLVTSEMKKHFACEVLTRKWIMLSALMLMHVLVSDLNGCSTVSRSVSQKKHMTSRAITDHFMISMTSPMYMRWGSSV